MEVHINQLTLPGDDRFTQQFNRCSDLFQKAHDPNASVEDQEQAWAQWYDERYRLETGQY